MLKLKLAAIGHLVLEIFMFEIINTHIQTTAQILSYKLTFEP